MIVKNIRVKQFRNIESANVSFARGMNVLYGENAQGKTNLLEAVYLASIGKSFRSPHIGELIRFGEECAEISLDFEGNGREQNITVRFSGNRSKTVEKNRVRVLKMSELVGAFRAVLFCPEHLSLIKDGPAERRLFLDIAISAADPLYLAALQRYDKCLKQRNALIKAGQKDRAVFEDTVDLWSEGMAHEAAYIERSRARYILAAERFVKDFFHDMTGEKEKPALSFSGCCGKDFEEYENLSKTEEICFQKLSENHERELLAGSTLYGVHKDDMDVRLNEKSARLFCSQGQQRSLVLALKLAEGELCKKDAGEYPVFLFDDVLSELDEQRRSYILEQIGEKQIIMTTCETGCFEKAKKISVKNGVYTED